jgi:hypothetical protein
VSEAQMMADINKSQSLNINYLNYNQNSSEFKTKLPIPDNIEFE